MTDEKEKHDVIQVVINSNCLLKDDSLDLIDGHFFTNVVSIKNGEVFEPPEYMRKRIALFALEKLVESFKEELRDD